jgi:D-alanyl-D-alanine carboxypeptidase (penicillin-binding protein 5/6)
MGSGRSPLSGGAMRRRRSRAPVVLTAILLPIAAFAVWLFLGSKATHEPPPPAALNGHSIERAQHGGRPSAKTGPPGISLIGGQTIRFRFKHPPTAALVFDVRTGQVLWARNPLKPLPIASLTKIMTAILVVQHTTSNEPALITHEALNATGSKVGELPRGRHVPVEALLAGMLLPSGNDAAIALADRVSGHADRFVTLMNRTARRMGLGCTHFASPDGIETKNRSCAADLAALARIAIAKPRIARLTGREQVHVRFPIKTGKLWLTSTNPLLRLRYPGTIGLKTGSTERAGHCFVAIVRRGNRELGVVLLHSPNIGDQSQRLFNAAFRQRP